MKIYLPALVLFLGLLILLGLFTAIPLLYGRGFSDAERQAICDDVAKSLMAGALRGFTLDPMTDAEANAFAEEIMVGVADRHGMDREDLVGFCK